MYFFSLFSMYSMFQKNKETPSDTGQLKFR
jgi:hypothetical protein